MHIAMHKVGKRARDSHASDMLRAIHRAVQSHAAVDMQQGHADSYMYWTTSGNWHSSDCSRTGRSGTSGYSIPVRSRNSSCVLVLQARHMDSGCIFSSLLLYIRKLESKWRGESGILAPREKEANSLRLFEYNNRHNTVLCRDTHVTLVQNLA